MSNSYELDRTERRVRDAVKVECEIKTETAGAQLIVYDGRPVWVPRSQIEDVIRESPRKDSGHDGYIIVARWLAERENFDFED